MFSVRSVCLFVCLSVCLFVSLSVCPSDYSQTCERILLKFFGGVGHGSRTKWYNFGGDPDHASDPGIQSPKSGSSGSAEVCSLWVHSCFQLSLVLCSKLFTVCYFSVLMVLYIVCSCGDDWHGELVIYCMLLQMLLPSLLWSMVCLLMSAALSQFTMDVWLWVAASHHAQWAWWS